MKKKGFTLIELLAVIVILAIIALIATPLVLKYIEKSRKESKVDSAYSFVRNLETEIANYSIKNNGKRYTTNKESIKELGLDITVKGENPTDGKVCISNTGQIEKGIFKYANYYVSYDGKKGFISDKDVFDNFSCIGSDLAVTEESGLYDIGGNLLYSWDELVNNYGIDIETDYYDYDEEEALIDESLWPGTILSTNEDLIKGVKLIIDDSVNKIGAAAFTSNTTLIEIIIPNSVTNIGMGAFENCINLIEVIMEKGVEGIGEFAFYGCESLTEITIPNSVTSIGGDAFGACTNLKKVIIPNSVTSIASGMFRECTNLTEIIIPNGISSIGYGVFSNCTSLTEITISDSVTAIGRESFSECKNLKTINYTGTQEQWKSITFAENWNNNMPSDYTINYNYVVQ